MTIAPDPAELTTPRDPAGYRRGRSRFWTPAAFGVSGVIVGVFLATFVSNLNTPGSRADVKGPLSETAAAPAFDASVPPVAATAAGLPAPSETGVSDLAGRVAALEADRTAITQAAAAALAAAALVEASQGSQPFPEELAALAAVSPPSAELRTLRGLAEAGAPSRAILAASFPDFAARAAAAARDPGDQAAFGERLGHALSRVVTIRRTGEVSGNGVDARLARAERQVGDGDIAGALRTLDGLPPEGREALATWRARAERRAEIDRRVASLRAMALRDLTRLSRSGA
jgi:hypothetical protein